MRIVLFFCIFIFVAGSTLSQVDTSKKEIYGIVTDFFGVPWKGVRIRLRAKEDRSPLELETSSDMNGQYRFTGLPEDSFEITLLRNDHTLYVEETKQTGLLFGSDPIRLDFGVEVGRLSECRYSVVGIVKNKNNGQPVGGAKVSIMNAFKEKTLSFGITEKNGFYKLSVCNLGQYLVFVNMPNFEVQATTVIFEFPEDHLKRLTFSIKPLPIKLRNWRRVNSRN